MFSCSTHLGFILTIIKLDIYSALIYSNCSVPRIEIHNRGKAWEFPCEQHVVELNLEGGVSKVYVECRDSSPVQWILDIHPSIDKFQFTRSFNQKVLHKEEGRELEYSNYFVFIQEQSDELYPTIFICQNICGNRNYLELRPDKWTIQKHVTSTPTLSIPKLNSSGTLVGLKKQKECDLVLTIKVTQGQSHELEYKWESKSKILKEILTSSPTTTDQGIYFRNLFRTIPQERNCVRKLEDEEECEECNQIIPEDDEDILNSAAFFARTDSLVRMAFKGIFTITKPRKFQFDWEVNLTDMIDFEAPSTLFVGLEFQLLCKVSTTYFSYGTLLTSDQVDLNIAQDCSKDFNYGETESWTSSGCREVTKLVNFMEGDVSINLTCSAPLWDWSGRVNKTKEVLILYTEFPNFLNKSLNSEIILEELTEKNVTFVCEGNGKPRPKLVWTFPNKDLNESVLINEDEVNDPYWISSTLTIDSVTPEHLGTYKCTVFNEVGNASRTFSLKIPLKGLSSSAKAGISSGLVLLILTGCLAALLIYRRIVINRRMYRTKLAATILEFKEGIKKHQHLKEKKAQFYKDEENQQQHHASILELPYNSRFEVERAKWEVADTLLGEGAFGFVRKGVVEIGLAQKQTVAVKTLRNSVEIDDFKSFLTELKIMAYIGHHANVVSLVAACSENIDQKEVMIGVEFCCNGSLWDYLQEKRNLFQTNDPQIDSDSSRKTYANLSNPVALTELDLYTWSYQIANGMEFLASKNVLHGDLATRNVLLSADKTAKISDFGLSRVLLDTKNYTKKSRVPLPWKWMPYESMTFLQFSTASDVWAYGVTLWEIFSLGESPYAGLSFGPEFIEKLKNGFRLGKPSLATDYGYNIMRHCWTHEVDARVNFTQLKSAFSELLDILTSPGSSLTPMIRRISQSAQLSLRHSPVAQPRRNRAPVKSPWYSNRPTQVPNLYLNV